MVSFDTKRRYAGDASRTQQVGNFRNTVINLPRLVGRLADEELVINEGKFQTCKLTEKEGVVAVSVSYRGQDTIFSNTELVGMFLNKLKTITQVETKTSVSDVVISVPPYFGDKERRALMDAAEVAGLNCLRTVNDITAAAVAYGMMKTDIPSEKPRTIVIIDIGFATFKAALVSVIKGSIEIKAHVFDANLGGRNFDEVLVTHFANHFMNTRKIDVRENKKALLRLWNACERIKKVLSGIQMTKLELEALMDGNDFSLEATRGQLEELSVDLLDKIGEHLQDLLALTNMKAEDINAIEIIGGTTRIPAVKRRIAHMFGKEPNTTLNADEAVSRGCALLCAMDSPLIRVREFKVTDVVHYPIILSIGDSIIGEVSRGSKINESISLQIPQENISFPFSIAAYYSQSKLLPVGTPSQLAKFTISAPKSMDTSCVRKATIFPLINASGCIEISDATAETETSEPGTVEEGQDPATVPLRVISRCFPLSIKSETFRIPRSSLNAMKEAEIAMTLHDKLVAEIDDSRNSVEEFIYEARQKLESVFGDTIGEEKSHISSRLSATENWLYEEGSDLGKEDYIKKLEELQLLFFPLETRFKEEQASPVSESSIGHTATENGNNPIPDMDMD